jgi:pyridoxamine 5'-phosphate oxidase
MSKAAQVRRDLADLRMEYAQRALSETEVDRDPIRQLIRWIDEAVAAEAHEPNAMTLATSDGVRPTARIVLAKLIDAHGLVFFTNYDSRKASQLDANPHAAGVFWWPEVERQVRVEGTVTRTSPQESADYFRRRPVQSRLAAAASPQSRVVASREELERLVAETARKYPGESVPCPGNWGGYRLRPHTMEFWQGRVGRLHDRIEYGLNENTEWVIRRLAP